jgi:N-acetylmuramoyl-L-alanine amidase
VLALLTAGCGSGAVTAAGTPSSPVAAPAPSPTGSATSAGSTGSTGSTGSASSVAPQAATAAPTGTRPVPRSTTSPAAARTSAPPARRPVVVIDPGHNGGNIDHLSQVTRLVDAGHGERKPCNEIGAQTPTGYAEHAFTWDVAVRLRSLLAARGIEVRLTRSSDHGVGPCVDVRGRFGNAAKADAVVSVHADGGPASGTGFHVIEAARPAGDKAASGGLALAVRKAMLAGSGLRYATYIAGGDGLDVRDDLAGLTLSNRPAVMVEAGNMANRADAALQTSAAGRQRVAAALATGILAFLAIR